MQKNSFTVAITVFASAKKEKLLQVSENVFEVYVKEPPQKNLANKRVLAILKDFFNAERVQILTGHKSPKKKVQIIK